MPRRPVVRRKQKSHWAIIDQGDLHIGTENTACERRRRTCDTGVIADFVASGKRSHHKLL